MHHSQSEGFIFYSGFTAEQLEQGHEYLLETIGGEEFGRNFICKKYAHKKFLKASTFSREWVAAYFAANMAQDYDSACGGDEHEEMLVDCA